MMNNYLQQKVQETNQIIEVDHRKLIDKVKDVPSSIKPVRLELPLINLNDGDY